MRKEYPEEFSARIVTRFLWFPLTLKNEQGRWERRWLETASFKEVYSDDLGWYPRGEWQE